MAKPDIAADPLQAMDDWCVKQLRALSEKTTLHVMAGGSVDDPAFCRLVGRNHALHQMRSFIHGARNV